MKTIIEILDEIAVREGYSGWSHATKSEDDKDINLIAVEAAEIYANQSKVMYVNNMVAEGNMEYDRGQDRSKKGKWIDVEILESKLLPRCWEAKTIPKKNGDPGYSEIKETKQEAMKALVSKLNSEGFKIWCCNESYNLS